MEHQSIVEKFKNEPQPWVKYVKVSKNDVKFKKKVLEDTHKVYLIKKIFKNIIISVGPGILQLLITKSLNN